MFGAPVTTPEDLNDWLENRDHATAGTIAVRAVARVWPLTVSYARLPEPGFSAARALLTAGAGVGGAAAAAARAAARAAMYVGGDRDAETAARFAADAAGYATDTAGYADDRDAADFPARAASYARAAAMDAARDVGYTAKTAWDVANAALQADCDLIAAQGPGALRNCGLWHDWPNPLRVEWDRARAALQSDPDFDFWRRWYDGLLQGRPLNQLCQNIALIPSDDWNQGPGHIAGRIAAIELAHNQQATPLAERVEWVPDTGRIRVTPVPMDNTDLYNTVIDKLRDALVDIRPDGRLGNTRAALADPLALLERTLKTYADNPQRVHDDMAMALAEIRRLVEAQEVDADLRVNRLVRTLDDNILDIEGGMPEVRATVQARLALRFQRLGKEGVQTLDDAGQAVIPLLESTDVQADMAADAGALHESDPNTEAAKPRLYRWISRMSRFLVILQDKAVEIGTQATTLAAAQSLVQNWLALVDLFRTLLGF